ncbi:MAG: hypothetical protein M1833_003617 [Piccolia ochrophora]|nr:MAG: hypothetical protein M1833_003617 [Piccolia ochrophora]
MLEDDWDAVAEGLPSVEDPFMQKYFGGRDALIAQEKKQRTDHTFRENLSPTAAEACSIVAKIRQHEHRTVWDEDSGASQRENVHPGMMFSLAKGHIENTRLWGIVRRMPKGALLHAHYDAMVNLDWLFEQALSTPGIHIRAPAALCSGAARESVPFTFVYAKTSVKKASIWSDGYIHNDTMSAVEAAETFPGGGRSQFLEWLRSRCTITLEQSTEHHLSQNLVWNKFRSVFQIIDSILFYEPIYRASVRHICEGLARDGIQWVEFRAACAFEYRREGCEVPEKSYSEVYRIFGEELDKFQASVEGKSFWGARIIWTALRSVDQRHIIESMKDCIEVKMDYPDLVAGFDLVGQENLGRSLKSLTPEFFWFRKRTMEEGLDIPLFLHAGECLGDGDETDHNLVDALLLGTRRIGHGFSLFKHPLLIDMVKEKRILVECCPISNEILRLTHSVASHPLPALLARGVPVALCNDDPAIFRYDAFGASHDFWQVLQGLENVGLEGLGSIAENSVRYAAFEDQSGKEWVQGVKDATLGRGVRASKLKEWAVEWERFCQWIIDEHGDAVGSDEDAER